MGLFKPKPPVDLDEFEWLMACFAWLHLTLGERDRADGHLPVLARPDTPEIAEANSGATLFEGVKALAGLESWDCELRQGDAKPDADFDSGLFLEQAGTRALGTFSFESANPVPRYGMFGEQLDPDAQSQNSAEAKRPVIHYDPGLLQNPDALVATFAHELAHLLGHTLGDPPGGEDLHEHATDCTAVYMGFGIFLANSARQFAQFQSGGMQGWRSSTSGYLSERALVTLLAMFVRTFSHSAEQASEPLKTYLRTDFAKALKYLDWRFPDFATAVRDIDLSDWA